MNPFPIHALSLIIFTFQLSAFARDYGDAPSSYGTKIDESGPSHGVLPTLFIGNLGPDNEADGFPDPAALGDDLNGIDDEDALIGASLIFLEGESYKLTVECTNQTGHLAKLAVWVDWNRDGVFKTDAVEYSVVDVPSAGLPQQIIVTLPPVPTGVVGDNPSGELSFIRLRLTTDLPALITPTGAAIDGEVEDWQIQMFENYDYGDLPDIGPGTGPGNYLTNRADGGPRHRMGSSVYLGQTVDGEFNAQPLASALGDDIDAPINDEDGVNVNNLVSGSTATFTVSATNQSESKAVVRAEVDLNQNGSFSDPGERQVRSVLAGSNNLPINFDFPIPPNLPVGTRLAARFRISTDPRMSNDPDIATVSDGEVEDYFFTLDPGRDWGDLPDRCPGSRAGHFNRGQIIPDYRTLAIDNGPSHAITPNLRISNDFGSIDFDVDSEPDGQPGPGADGDDTDGNHDDLALVSVLTSHRFISHPLGTDHSKLEMQLFISHAIHNTTGSNATFYAFLDANRDGDFEDPGERSSTIIPGDGSVTEASALFDFTIPWPGVLNWHETFALRCRISSAPNLGAYGPAPDGEVQDDLIRMSLSIANPRPLVADPEDHEIIHLEGGTMTAVLGTPFFPLAEDVVPAGLENLQNPIWSLLRNGDVMAGGVLNFDADTMSSLGVGLHPVTLTQSQADGRILYVIHCWLKIVDLPGYAAWAAASNLPARANRPELDPDSDGYPNLVEFALGSRADLPGSLPSTPLDTENDPTHLTMSYPRPAGGLLTAQGYRVGELLFREQGSADLVDWEEPTSAVGDPIDLPVLPVDYEWNSFRLTTPISANNSGFLRVQIELSCEEHP